MLFNLHASLIYNGALCLYHKNNFVSHFVHRKQIKNSKTGEGTIITRVNKQWMVCPPSHKLPFFQKDFPLYDRQLAQICSFIHLRKKRDLLIIDAGANVGDTVLNIGIKNAFYLCIEGDPKFSKYIKYNLKGYQYALEEVYLCDKEDNTNYVVQTSNGTGHLIQSDGLGENIKTVTLDNLLNSKYGNKQFDLLKVDTDGFDFKVIRGAKQCLQRCHPLLFFEWDKAFCKEQGEDPLSIFPILDDLGYKECILFDNFGNLFDKIDTNNISLLRTSIENTIGEGLPYYYDVLAIPENKGYNAAELISLFR